MTDARGEDKMVLIATGEPRGAYHLTILGEAIESVKGVKFVHFTPYFEPRQGESVVEQSDNWRLIDKVSLLVVTGGVFSAWTALAAQVAAEKSVPVMFTQLAYAPPHEPPDWPAVCCASALSGADSVNLQNYLRLPEERVTVTGQPILDNPPAWQPEHRRILLVSTSDMTLRDPELHLVELGRTLQGNGWEVSVWLHPRQDPEEWAGFTIAREARLVEAAAKASVVVAYPGSALAQVAALPVPLLVLSPTRDTEFELPESIKAVAWAWCTTWSETLGVLWALDMLTPPEPRSLVENAVGPVGGACDRVVQLWAGHPH